MFYYRTHTIYLLLSGRLNFLWPLRFFAHFNLQRLYFASRYNFRSARFSFLLFQFRSFESWKCRIRHFMRLPIATICIQSFFYLLVRYNLLYRWNETQENITLNYHYDVVGSKQIKHFQTDSFRLIAKLHSNYGYWNQQTLVILFNDRNKCSHSIMCTLSECMRKWNKKTAFVVCCWKLLNESTSFFCCENKVYTHFLHKANIYKYRQCVFVVCLKFNIKLQIAFKVYKTCSKQKYWC